MRFDDPVHDDVHAVFSRSLGAGNEQGAQIVEKNGEEHEEEIHRLPPAVEQQAYRQQQEIAEAPGAEIIEQQRTRQKEKQKTLLEKTTEGPPLRKGRIRNAPDPPLRIMISLGKQLGQSLRLGRDQQDHAVALTEQLRLSYHEVCAASFPFFLLFLAQSALEKA